MTLQCLVSDRLISGPKCPVVSGALSQMPSSTCEHHPSRWPNSSQGEARWGAWQGEGVAVPLGLTRVNRAHLGTQGARKAGKGRQHMRASPQQVAQVTAGRGAVELLLGRDRPLQVDHVSLLLWNHPNDLRCLARQYHVPCMGCSLNCHSGRSYRPSDGPCTDEQGARWTSHC